MKNKTTKITEFKEPFCGVVVVELAGTKKEDYPSIVLFGLRCLRKSMLRGIKEHPRGK